MQFGLIARIGFGAVTRNLPPLVVAQTDIDHVAQYAGAYHVLEMGQHFRDYVEQGNMPLFAAVNGFPGNAYFEPLTNKQRAQGVTGNIGEGIAGIVAERVLGIQPDGIAHIRLQRPFRKRQCPDFMIRMGGTFSAAIAGLGPLIPSYSCPEWWPLESKARVDGNACDAAVNDAFRQLAAYWYTIVRGARAADVGYGIVVTCAYDRNRGVGIRIFAPNNLLALQTHLQAFPNYDAFVAGYDAHFGTLRGLVHG